MSTDAPLIRGVDLTDDHEPRPVTDSRIVYEGMIWDVRRDTVDLGGRTVDRDYIEHPGAVVIVALRDDPVGKVEVMLIKQYRHPIGTTEWELPAGLLDKEGESPLEAAQRELAEEVDLRAEQWHALVDFRPSPGATSEAIRVFVAQDLSDVPEADLHHREDEEADMTRAWVDLDEAFAAVLAGRIANAGAVVGIMAAHGAKQADWVTLRDADAPWPGHPRFR
ncbi:NUDIX domain-containing protein [Mobilicoccus massiliensis]|uniref:NUDIX domain-containing protein n=1 Tax=Mobilicoccus massiliensis TaxID=1522310 RepID=UPI00058B6AD3|nr:NUDIX hydrolase [Mobilicoccus massiliensis]